MAEFDPYQPKPSNRQVGFYQAALDDGVCPACVDGDDDVNEIVAWGSYRADHNFELYPHGLCVALYSTFDEDKYEWSCYTIEMLI